VILFLIILILGSSCETEHKNSTTQILEELFTPTSTQISTATQKPTASPSIEPSATMPPSPIPTEEETSVKSCIGLEISREELQTVYEELGLEFVGLTEAVPPEKFYFSESSHSEEGIIGKYNHFSPETDLTIALVLEGPEENVYYLRLFIFSPPFFSENPPSEIQRSVMVDYFLPIFDIAFPHLDNEEWLKLHLEMLSKDSFLAYRVGNIGIILELEVGQGFSPSISISFEPIEGCD
jgi:hypothetical protein